MTHQHRPDVGSAQVTRARAGRPFSFTVDDCRIHLYQRAPVSDRSIFASATRNGRPLRWGQDGLSRYAGAPDRITALRALASAAGLDAERLLDVYCAIPTHLLPKPQALQPL